MKAYKNVATNSMERTTFLQLYREAYQKALTMKRCCPDGVTIKIIDVSGGKVLGKGSDWEVTIIPRE